MNPALNAASLSLARVGTNFLSFLLFLAISRAFGPEGTGAYSYAFAIATLASVVISLGADDFGLREYARLAPETRPAFLARLLGAHAGVALLTGAALALLLGGSETAGRSAGMISMLAVYQACFAVVRTLFIPAFVREAMLGPALAELVCRGGANLVALVAIAGFGRSTAEALAVFPLSGLVLVAWAWRSARHFGARPSLRASAASIAGTLRALWSFVAGGILSELYPRVGLLLLPVLAGEAATGYFATAAKFLEVGLLPIYFLGLALYPRLCAEFHSDRGAFAARIGSLARASLLLGALVGCGLLGVVPAILVPLLGPGFEPAIPAMRWVALVVLLESLELAGMRLLMAADRNPARLAAFALGLALNLALDLALIPRFGATGAVLGWALSLVPVLACYAVAARGLLRA